MPHTRQLPHLLTHACNRAQSSLRAQYAIYLQLRLRRYDGNPVSLSRQADRQMQQLGYAFLDPAFMCQQLHGALTQLAGSALQAVPEAPEPPASGLQHEALAATGGPSAADLDALTACLRAFMGVASLDVAAGRGALLSTTSRRLGGHVTSLEELDAAVQQLMRQLMLAPAGLPAGTRPASVGPAPADAVSLAHAAERVRLRSGLLTREVFKSSIVVIREDFVAEAERSCRGEGRWPWHLAHLWCGGHTPCPTVAWGARPLTAATSKRMQFLCFGSATAWCTPDRVVQSM